jgi:pimeloyl-ACP methyl ester carboxylesterase
MPARTSRLGIPLLAVCVLFLSFMQSSTAPAASDAASASRFTVSIEGNGPDVILIPGLASSSTVWREEAKKLTNHRLYLVQVAGFAGQPAGANADGPIIAPLVEELAAYIKRNKLQHPAIIGHSLGGLIGLLLADKHPDVVGKLMIVDTLPFFGMVFGPTMSTAVLEPRAAAMRDGIMHQTQEQYAASEPKIMAGLVKSKGPEAQAAIAAASASDHRVVARALYEDFMTDLRQELPRIKTPIVMLYPFDPAMGATPADIDSLYQGAYAGLPNKRLVRIDNSFHFIQLDQPDAFDKEVQKFLNQ